MSTHHNLQEWNQLVIDHIHLVKYAVGRMNINLPPGLTRDDLISMGSWGLVDAARRFDTGKGVLFKTYALIRIRGAILDELRRHTLGGQALCRKARNLEKAIQKIEAQSPGKSASDDDIAAELKLSKSQLQTLYINISHSFLLSLDEPSHSNEIGESVVDTLPDNQSLQPSAHVESKEQKEHILKTLKRLNRQEQLVLSLYYYEGLTFKEIGLVLNVSESRISQIHTKAIVHLRHYLKNAS